VAQRADIAGSVANYLARHDWQKGRPVLLPAAIA
jgi:membrane-bound lytic murein transglycosylase B